MCEHSRFAGRRVTATCLLSSSSRDGMPQHHLYSHDHSRSNACYCSSGTPTIRTTPYSRRKAGCTRSSTRSKQSSRALQQSVCDPRHMLYFLRSRYTKIRATILKRRLNTDRGAYSDRPANWHRTSKRCSASTTTSASLLQVLPRMLVF